MSILDLLFPKRCLGCRKFGTYICPSCSKTLTPLSAQICPECTRPAIDGVTHPGCRGRYRLDGFMACYSYRGIVRTALRKLKYGQRLTDIGQTISKLVWQSLLTDSPFYQFLETKPILAPVPLHWIRLLTRGFNHAETLGKTVAFDLKLPFTVPILRRRRYTKPQYGLSREDREDNIVNVFALSKIGTALLKKKAITSILLFDDVWTTGTTLRACAKVLKRAGVKKVWALTVAH